MVRQGTSGTGGSRPKASAPRQSGRKSGRPPLRRVYRRRRLFAGVVLLLVIAVAFGGFVAVSNAMGGGQPSGAQPSGAGAAPAASPAASASGSPTASGEASASPTATSGEGCEQNLITVTAATDKPAYAAGEKPLLSLTVTNNNKMPCEVNLGTSQMEYMITSGSDRIFSSRDCQAESADLMKTIAPGKSETANFPWQRNRTVQGCEPVEATPGAGGAYYVFTARLANKNSPKAVFQLS
ncbi:hypothetical protein [Arthrobacter sp. 131MFCol6.1]|uniref:hypothetical protein n=1 Tax=Arthrobacter sp. 131MFCol6.1 TaxID=1157944 RepID=UPI0004780F4B|nr:hypothetical protein [Arthrobacter sp. 131MFCol6.1]